MSTQFFPSKNRSLLGLALLLSAAGLGAFAMWWFMPPKGPAEARADVLPLVHVAAGEQTARSQNVAFAEPAQREMPAEASTVETVQLEQDRWQSSGLKIEPVSRGPFMNSVRLTGKISLNQDRLAHIYPMVEGTVENVSVQLGQKVHADDLLVVIHSREIGQAKLDLYQARLGREMALVKDQRQREVSKNAIELLDALRKRTPITEIESQFRNRSMGDYRERLLASYSNYLKSQADVSRLEGLVESGAVSAKQLLAAEANRNADLATFQSRLEQIAFEMESSLLASSQAVKQSETEVAVAETSLRILGYEQDDLDEVDPAKQGETISHYPIRSPFDGTVLTKDVVLREQVRPDGLVLSIADLSTVWVTADVYQQHVPLIGALKDRTVIIRNEAWPDRTFEARVFYTGDVMDESSRTIAMRAIADNKDGLLKPGMFVTVELPAVAEGDVLQVPRSALLEYEGQKFVFIHQGGDAFVRRNVTIGTEGETSVIIEDGLESGESVVSSGGFVLKSLMLADMMGEE